MTADTAFQLPEQFELLSVIGEGPMGVVYKARNRFTDRIVAIKMLPVSNFTEQSLIRFQREAKASSAFSHPNAVSVFDFALCTDGSPYFVMEYAPGKSLAAILKKQGRLDEQFVFEIFLQVCDVLTSAHRAGVVHRDIKPGNIMVDEERKVKVLDFGIAKFVQDEEQPAGRAVPETAASREQQYLTRTGLVIGTPLYMSPEQCNGAPVDTRTDIYSVGAVMYHCLTGTPPHSGATAYETMRKKIADDTLQFDRSLKISREIESIVRKCLMRVPAERYQSAEALLGDLRQIKFGFNRLLSKRNLAAASALFLVAGVAFGSMLFRKSQIARPAVTNSDRNAHPSSAVQPGHAESANQQIVPEARNSSTSQPASTPTSTAVMAISDEETLVSTRNYARRLMADKRFSEAASCWRNVADYLKKTRPEADLDVSNAYCQLAAVQGTLNEYAAAADSLDQALRHRPTLTNEERVAWNMWYAEIYRHIGTDEALEQCADKIEAALKDQHKYFPDNLVLKGEILQQQGRLELKLQHFARSLKLLTESRTCLETAGRANIPIMAIGYWDIARSCRGLGRTAEAFGYYSKARQLLVENHMGGDVRQLDEEVATVRRRVENARP